MKSKYTIKALVRSLTEQAIGRPYYAEQFQHETELVRPSHMSIRDEWCMSVRGQWDVLAILELR